MLGVVGRDQALADRDLLLWGATGYTGRLVARHLADHAPAGLRWAIGGRDRSKLQGLREEIGADVEVVLGDSLDPASMEEAVRPTRVVISTVGPYARYGTTLVEACVSQGVDYCDITGEAHWIRDNIDRVHGQAVESGARVVHCCGFDSIPSDVGVWMLHDHLRSVHGRRLAAAQFLLVKIKGGLSGGTAASMLNLMERAGRDPHVRGVLSDPYALNPEGERRGPDGPDQHHARYDEESGRWTAPFLMAGINTRIVRRTNALLDYPYGREFRYAEVVAARGRMQAQLTSLGLKAMILGGFFAPSRWLMRRFLPNAGEGPSPEAREAGFFEIRLRGQSDGPAPLRIHGRIRGEHDPGYGETSRMLAESGLCLALDELPTRAGILTPAACMGAALLKRLRAAGMTFEVGDDAVRSTRMLETG